MSDKTDQLNAAWRAASLLLDEWRSGGDDCHVADMALRGVAAGICAAQGWGTPGTLDQVLTKLAAPASMIKTAAALAAYASQGMAKPLSDQDVASANACRASLVSYLGTLLTTLGADQVSTP